MLKELTKFHHQQVVVNTYNDEELVKRDGIWFEKIVEDNGYLHFVKEGSVILSIKVEGKELKKEPVFKNFYTVNEHTQRIEIYFP
ncbi:MAG: hypothetical protein Q8934_10050 [Bacillota bacterium]|nr:hypothetical protein [Bacillota bacterium]